MLLGENETGLGDREALDVRSLRYLSEKSAVGLCGSCRPNSRCGKAIPVP
jgi:hypothetical protein